MALAFFGLAEKSLAESKEFRAVPTFYWPGEVGSRYDCDGNKLHSGIAAVDFDRINKNSVLNIGGILTVVAKDCGGRDVISCKAARERGLGRLPVIDIWAPSEEAAMRMAEKLPNVVTVTYETGSKPKLETQSVAKVDKPKLKIHSSGYFITKIKNKEMPIFVCYSSKNVQEHARIERYDERILACN